MTRDQKSKQIKAELEKRGYIVESIDRKISQNGYEFEIIHKVDCERFELYPLDCATFYNIGFIDYKSEMDESTEGEKSLKYKGELIYIDFDKRNRGYASMLLSYFIEYARSQKVSKIYGIIPYFTRSEKN